jgi:hypothetical protein
MVEDPSAEAHWLDQVNGGGTGLMLDALESRGLDTERKLRLFAVAACRRLWHRFGDARSRAAVEAAERYADGLIDRAELEEAGARAWEASEELERLADATPADDRTGLQVESHLAWAAWALVHLKRTRDMPSRPLPRPRPTPEEAARLVPDASELGANLATALYHAVVSDWRPKGLADVAMEDELRAHRRLMREVFGNPFRPVRFDPGWRAPAVAALAARIYAERDFAALPVLADLLEEAGCTAAQVLAHLRTGTGHVRGCWALDLVLGKS